jgi:hypothetical protein
VAEDERERHADDRDRREQQEQDGGVRDGPGRLPPSYGWAATDVMRNSSPRSAADCRFADVTPAGGPAATAA